MRLLLSLLLTSGFLLAVGTRSEAQSLQESLKDTDIAPHWIYDDFAKAKAQAKETGKPILVVLRCVPCPPGKTLDGQLKQPDAEVEKLEKNFVCVRIIQTKGLDLKTFQYDMDQSWVAMFLNADGTIYGRYGTRTERGPNSDVHLSLPTFRKAAEKVLEIHKNYPANKNQLKGKTGPEPDYATPDVIPGLQERAKTARLGCIRCHMVRDQTIRVKWQEKKLTERDLFVYPMPNTFGLAMDPKEGLTVQSVSADSPAAKAGLAAGDELVAINGQPLISLADVQWVLHTSPNETKLAISLKRDGKTLDKTIELSGNWKETDIGWRTTTWFGLRQGLKLDPPTPEERKKHGLADKEAGLIVRGLFGPGPAPLQKAGLAANDVILAVDGKPVPATESQFLTSLRLQKWPGDSVKLTIARGSERKELTIPMW